VRQGGGCNDHPTMTTFLQLYRLLSLYAPTSRTLKGNVVPENEKPISIVHYSEILLGRAKSLKANREERRKEIEDKILGSLIDSFSGNRYNFILDEHNYAKPQTQDCLVYNLCGYIASRSEKFTSCIDCCSSLHMSYPVLSSVSLLTIIKDLGGLKYPSYALFSLIKDQIEPAVTSVLGNREALVGDAISTILGNVNSLHCGGIGCNVDSHKFPLVTSLISYYINVRAFFFIRVFNEQQVKSQSKTKKKRKTVKLV